MGEKLTRIALTEITESPVALRSVNTESEDFQSLLDSIKARGVKETITVRPGDDGKYVIINGLHRYTASKLAGLEDIPCHILDVDEIESLELQVITNVQKIETKPVEYSKQLRRILAAKPTMTMAELASKINKSSAWIAARFNLLKLDTKIQELVDENEISLSNAYVLVKLPEEERNNYVDRAMTMPPTEFGPLVDERVREIRKANSEGKDSKPEEYMPIPTCRKIAEIKEELAEPKVGLGIIANEELDSADQGWNAAIKWVMRVDADSAAEGKAKFDARIKAAQEARERRKEEAAKKKAEKAAEKAEELKAEAAPSPEMAEVV